MMMLGNKMTLAVLATLVSCAAAQPQNGVYGLGTVVDIHGRNASLAQFAGNVSIFVNVATY